MQRSVTVLLASLLAGLLSTGCPEKRVEKEEPVAPTDQSGAEVKAGADKGADKAAADEERPDEGEEHGEEAKDDRKPLRKKTVEKKKEAAPEEKDQGGW